MFNRRILIAAALAGSVAAAGSALAQTKPTAVDTEVLVVSITPKA